MPVTDPRRGDIEDDFSSPKRRSLLSLAGSVLLEISIPKLLFSWLMLFALPSFLIGLTPLIVFAWFNLVHAKSAYLLVGLWPLLLLIVLFGVAFFGGRWLWRIAESSFWSLHSLAVQPLYLVFSELFRHFCEKLFRAQLSRQRVSALASCGAGLAMGGGAAAIAWIAWPHTHWVADVSMLSSPARIVAIGIANGVVLTGAYLAVASLIWAVADTTLSPPADLGAFLDPYNDEDCLRVVHLSDVHAVGERYGFRIESGRSGPQGNDRLQRAFERLSQIHQENAIHLILVTGDMTDAGRSTEWSEFLDILNRYPALAQRTYLVPGNHDLNIVDRGNPARFDFPLSPNRMLRRTRYLSATSALTGAQLHPINLEGPRHRTLAQLLESFRQESVTFVDTGRPRVPKVLENLWASIFPLVLPPASPNGIGLILLNSNAETHFSFTNALGMISSDQMTGIQAAVARYPLACWLIALHHHIVEYPQATKLLSTRIGTALINGTWFVRRLRNLAGRVVILHGHRHVDWIGEYSGLLIASAPSPVMERTEQQQGYFYIHRFVTRSGRIGMLPPEKILIEGSPR